MLSLLVEHRLHSCIYPFSTLVLKLTLCVTLVSDGNCVCNNINLALLLQYSTRDELRMCLSRVHQLPEIFPASGIFPFLCALIYFLVLALCDCMHV